MAEQLPCYRQRATQRRQWSVYGASSERKQCTPGYSRRVHPEGSRRTLEVVR